jgi:hypothetical protein
MMGEKKRRDAARPVFEFKETRLAGGACLNCGKVLDAATNYEGYEPIEGGITICIYCGHIMAFDAQLKFRQLTDEEMLAIAGDKRILKLQEARGYVMRFHSKKGAVNDQMYTRYLVRSSQKN